MESGFLLDVVVSQSSAVFQLLSGEDESLLIRGDTLLVLNLGLDVLNGVRVLNVQSDSLSSEGLDEDLHTSSESEDQVKSRFFLDVVVSQSSAVFQLFAGEDESLLIRGDAFLVLDLGLDVLNGVRVLNIEGDSLAGQSLDEDLHASSESEDQMESRFLLDVVVSKGSAIFELFTSEDESLLIRGDAFLVLDLSLDVLDGVRVLHVESDGFSS